MNLIVLVSKFTDNPEVSRIVHEVNADGLVSPSHRHIVIITGRCVGAKPSARYR